MSKLHFYANNSKEADGDGTLNQGLGFTADITWGKVKQGFTYEVRQGISLNGDQYPCTVGAEKGGQAAFGDV